jgi:hypothetical protein
MLSKKVLFIFTILSMLILCPAFAIFSPDTEVINRNAPLFPHMLFTETIMNWRRAEAARPYWVNTREEFENQRRMTENQVSILLSHDILAYYGHPYSRNMGILGRHSIEELHQLLSVTAAKYEAESGGRKIRKAFYLIYGTVWPEGEIGILRNETLMRYIEYGLQNDILIFIDHQMGRHDPVDSLRRMLPYLRFPNVHLALDPEWRTTRPMREIGHLTAEEINQIQQVMEDYIIENDIPGERLLVIHQFNWRMIVRREMVRADFDRVRLVHHISGIGTPTEKRETYDFFAQTTNMPIKGFKLWYDFGIVGHTDNPLMTPREVYDLTPRPYVIMYQ